MSPQPNMKPAPEKIGDYTVHPAASVLPLLEGEAFEELKQSIKEHGQLEPIKLDKSEVLLDGRNRLRACLELKIEPWCVVYETRFKGEVPVPPEDFIMAENLWRRHLSDDQKMLYAAEILLQKEAEAAKIRQQTAGKQHGRGQKKKVGANSTQAIRQPKVTEKIAAAAKGTDYSARQAVAVLKDAPDLAEPVKQGKMALKDAAAEAHTRKAEKIGAKVPPPPKPAAPPAPVDQDKLILTHAAELFKQYELAPKVRLADEFKAKVYKKLEELLGPPEDDSPSDRRSRPQRWQDAVEELKELQREYEEWRDKATDLGSATMDKLTEVTILDLSILDIDLPLGFGRD